MFTIISNDFENPCKWRSQDPITRRKRGERMKLDHVWLGGGESAEVRKRPGQGFKTRRASPLGFVLRGSSSFFHTSLPAAAERTVSSRANVPFRGS